MDQEGTWLAHNYHPLDIVIHAGHGAWVEDVQGRRYLDCLAGYSALNFGHTNRRLVRAAKAQLDTITMTSRAFRNDQLGPFARELAEFAGAEMVLPMNTGAEAVETAIKTARAWGYRVKAVPENRANIIVMGSNFHGRTTTVISFSDDDDARSDFGPYTAGFRMAPFGDLGAVRDLMDDNTVAVLTEPIQGEAGVIIPPPSFLPGVRQLCTENNILLIADEIQSGLGRTGTNFACDLWAVTPDLMTLGKALGGGIVPVSAVVGRADVLGVLEPGQHGSTFGGNPLSAAVGREVVQMLNEGDCQANVRELAPRMHAGLQELADAGIGVVNFTHVGLWSGVTIDSGSGRELCERLAAHGVLAKDTHGHTVRLSPPLMMSRGDMDVMFEGLSAALHDLARTN
ncbi:MAG: ornithine--oxo-acid transaminase [Ancrocorticia sp.]|uniref:ornithine--oxo-acid transaminase n=1 Tax=Ancrocorticia sp. TaxID=2593684 RepID=UPI003F93EBF2